MPKSELSYQITMKVMIKELYIHEKVGNCTNSVQHCNMKLGGYIFNGNADVEYTHIGNRSVLGQNLMSAPVEVITLITDDSEDEPVEVEHESERNTMKGK